MIYGLLDPRSMAIADMLMQQTNNNPMSLLAEFNPNMMDDETLFNQNYDDLSDDEIRLLEAEQQRRNNRLIEERNKKLEEDMNKYREKIYQEKLVQSDKIKQPPKGILGIRG